MTHWLYRGASMVGVLLLPSLTGCVIHKASPPPVVAVAPTPEQPAAPLYFADLNQGGSTLPDMPEPPLPNAQPTPPPQSEIEIARSKRPAPPARRTRGRKGEIELAERENREREREKDKEQDGAQSSGAAAAEANQSTAAIAPAVDKVTAPTPAGDNSQATTIGPLTASTTQDDGSKHQAVDLIDTTQRGINSLHRVLSGEQEKTVAQIRSFLIQAQRAMHNGDVDGAFTLATKAKVLLDELNGTT